MVVEEDKAALAREACIGFPLVKNKISKVKISDKVHV